MEMNDKDWKDILSREWMKDFPSLTNEDIQLLLTNIFYQVFLIQLDRIKITTDADEDGMRVKFTLEGEAYKDSDSDILEEGD